MARAGDFSFRFIMDVCIYCWLNRIYLHRITNRTLIVYGYMPIVQQIGFKQFKTGLEKKIGSMVSVRTTNRLQVSNDAFELLWGQSNQLKILVTSKINGEKFKLPL